MPRAILGPPSERDDALDLAQIRYFLALARTRNFTRAAELCNVTQPALSRAIQKLEDELGGPLVLRERALTQLTELGRSMLPLLQQTHDAAEAVRRRAEGHRGGAEGAPLRLGLAPEVNLEMLLPLLQEVARRVEGFQLTLRRREEEALVEALLEGELHLVVLPQGSALPDRLNHWPLWTEQVVVLAGAAHPLAGGESALAVEALAAHGVLEPRHRGTAGVFAGLRERVAVVPHAAEGLEDAAALVRLGLGLALAPGSLRRPEGTVAHALAEPSARFPMLLAVAAGRPMNAAVSAFAKLARARAWQDG